MSAELRLRFEKQPLDAVLDTIGIQQLYAGSRHFLKPDGRYVATGIRVRAWTMWDFLTSVRQMLANALWPISPWLGGTGRAWVGSSMMGMKPEAMERLVDLAAEGKIRVAVDRVLPFEKAVDGYEMLEQKKGCGKVVVEVNGSG
jgi:reticulon-4-interacting protein 1, mitochondrial